MPFQREQFFITGAQMRRAVEDMGDEGRLPLRETNRMHS
jgi:hypothetical protein